MPKVFFIYKMEHHNLKQANLKLAKLVKLKSTSLKSRKWMVLFFEPIILAKTNVTLPLPLSSFNVNV